MPLPLEVLADLRLAVDGEAIDIRGTGDRLVVDLPSLRAGRRLLSSGPFAHHQARTTARVHEALELSGITAEVRLQGTRIARIGAGAQPGMLGRLLPFRGVEVTPAPPLRAALRRRPVVTLALIAALLALLGWWLLRSSEA
jgi:hypothetical protein